MNMEEYLTLENKRLEINKKHLENGVNFIDIRAAYIGEEVIIGKGTIIGPCVTLEGRVIIGDDCVIGQNTKIKDSTIGDRTEIQSSVITESRVGCDTTVGPFAYLRPKSDVGNHCKVGDFVEIKNSSMGDGAKASHLTYIGDADVGRDVNIGCGVVFVNYDGTHKHRSTVGDGSFIGCNTNIVSPIIIEEEAYIAAGTTVTKNVPKGALCVARVRDKIIEGWVERRGLLKKKI
ncbi:DapH/DapD/GlmU-related protein [Clostridium aminobutyricum]|uniref:UDP-N-acetylglucosamine diphosphorylase n=1 Tax=Clostridium aminobutyricum TaxID=33953 RepID=A0A939DAS5_CLOAM|nr:DapH/DapD/GlmU-related protein [Clostridium aminobutyricum]MBN7774172.1 UDP-N-acetylglucosamine diphosphorylase [Clostridium aminobutyricum]